MVTLEHCVSLSAYEKSWGKSQSLNPRGRDRPWPLSRLAGPVRGSEDYTLLDITSVLFPHFRGRGLITVNYVTKGFKFVILS